MGLIISFILLLILNAFFDAYLISELKQIDHVKSTFVWAIIYTIVGGLLFWKGCVSRALLLRAVGLLPFFRWIIHDLLLNTLRGKQWDYLGSGKHASILDKFLSRLPFHFIWLKLGLLVIVGVLAFL